MIDPLSVENHSFNLKTDFLVQSRSKAICPIRLDFFVCFYNTNRKLFGIECFRILSGRWKIFNSLVSSEHRRVVVCIQYEFSLSMLYNSIVQYLPTVVQYLLYSAGEQCIWDGACVLYICHIVLKGILWFTCMPFNLIMSAVKLNQIEFVSGNSSLFFPPRHELLIQ